MYCSVVALVDYLVIKHQTGCGPTAAQSHVPDPRRLCNPAPDTVFRLPAVLEEIIFKSAVKDRLLRICLT